MTRCSLSVRRSFPRYGCFHLEAPCLTDDQWEQASLPVRFAGLGVNQTKVIAGSAYIGSCALTKDLVVALLKRDSSPYEPPELSVLLSAHEVATGAVHDFTTLSTTIGSAAALYRTARVCFQAFEGQTECAFSKSHACVFHASCQ